MLRPAGVYHSFGDALVIEVGDLFPGMEVLEQGGPTLPRGKCIVGMVHSHALLRGQVSGAPV